MIVDPEDVTKLLREHLGVPMRKLRHLGYLAAEETDQSNDDHLAEDPLRVSYQWGGKELGFDCKRSIIGQIRTTCVCKPCRNVKLRRNAGVRRHV